MDKWIKSLGKSALDFFIYIGGTFNLLVGTMFQVFTPPFKRKDLFAQMFKIGVMSFPIVFLVSFFTGMVLALQSAYQMTKMNAQMYISALVAFRW